MRDKQIIIIACHAIYRGGPLDSDDSWILLPYQQGNGHVSRFLDHIECGLSKLKENPESLLVFSGGVTRDGATQSEAATYLMAAEQTASFDESFRDRIVLEEYARDSYENLLFGTAAAFAETKEFPESITVIGFSFKRDRFFFHAKCIGLDPDGTTKGRLPRFDYIGVNDPQDMEGPAKGEALAMQQFLDDPHGTGAELSSKRKDRNPRNRVPIYRPTADAWPALGGLLDLNLVTG